MLVEPTTIFQLKNNNNNNNSNSNSTINICILLLHQAALLFLVQNIFHTDNTLYCVIEL